MTPARRRRQILHLLGPGLLVLGLTAPAGAANDASISTASSQVPAALVPGTSGTVVMRVVNTGSTTWTAGQAYRLGAGPSSQIDWSGFMCGGYANNPGDARVFLCHDVAPGGSHDFRFQVSMPAGAVGPRRLSVRMVRDGVEWFGPEQSWTVAADAGCPHASLPVPGDRWRLEIWNNRGFVGEPVERRYEAIGSGGFTFAWGTGRASGCTGNDDWAVRFERQVSLASGDYTFVTTTDDGVRLWVDGTLVIDGWRDQAPTTYRATRLLTAGTHELRMDYYENGGGAHAALGWSYTPVALANDAEVRVAESVVPAALALGAQAAVTVRVANTGSTTWTAGTLYRLGAAATNQVTWSGGACGGYTNGPGDGRVYLCHDVPPGGTHDFRFDVAMPAAATGSRRLAVRMVRDGVEWFGGEQGWTVAVDESCPTAPLAIPGDRWRMEIWDNRFLAGSPVERRYDAPGPGGFAFDWGGGGPSNCAGTDGFGVRFTRVVQIPESGEYTFVTTTDDGARLWIDGTLWIDRWQDQPPTSHRATGYLASGPHELSMDYYENAGGALAELRWESATVDAEANLYGMNIDPANPAGSPGAQRLRDLGVRWVRIEWKATHREAFYDPRIAAYRRAGLKVLLLVDYASVPPKPASNAGDAAWRDYLGRFSARLRELAAHYGDGVDAWQIWNEPDLLRPGTAYDPGVPAHHFGAMLRDAAGAVRPGSSRPIVTGGLASGDPGYLRAARDAVGGLTVDAVAVHPYGQRAPDGWPRPDWGFGDMSDLFDRYLAFGLPLWVSEIGTEDESVQAPYLENVYRLARDGYGERVETVFWFCWSDGMVPPFGILRTSGEPKPAYERYDTLTPPW